MLGYFLIGVLGVLVCLAIFIATRPGEFRLARSGMIDASPAEVFPHVNNFHNWDAWSPWAKLDPNAKNSFTGPESGEGAEFAWEGNKQVGAGNMRITDSRPHELVRICLNFLKPFKATNTTEFLFEPVGNQTRVTWSMHGKNNFLAKAFSLVMDCEKMVGPEFEKGLANMKRVVEQRETAPVA